MLVKRILILKSASLLNMLLLMMLCAGTLTSFVGIFFDSSLNALCNVSGVCTVNTLPCYSLTHGAEPFLRSCQLCSHSRTSQHFIEPEGPLPCSQEPSTGSYPEQDQSNPYHPILRSILILSTHLRLGLSSGPYY
jgi:hypothetical protein